jgi:hypothetical protein
LIDQGLDDQFYAQLNPEKFKQACLKAGQHLTLRQHEGYDHGYYFIQSFIDDHLQFHAIQLEKGRWRIISAAIPLEILVEPYDLDDQLQLFQVVMVILLIFNSNI